MSTCKMFDVSPKSNRVANSVSSKLGETLILCVPRMPTYNFKHFESRRFLCRQIKDIMSFMYIAIDYSTPYTYMAIILCMASHHADLYRIVGEVKSSQ